ncbi:hypothetical protein [Rhodopila sp.]|uniref:hypothetical protein n=1 Tax=Rhodopila sp. TaxID=2480087 RepID=UPI003D0BEE51
MAAELTPSDTLIAGRYAVDAGRRLHDAGGGLPAFAATDRQSGEARLVALAVGRHASPRLLAMQSLTGPIDNLMIPLGHGVGPRPGGGQGYYVICSAPSGPPVSSSTEAWSEAALLEHVLRPAAQVLVALQGIGVTHRAIRPDNMFIAARGQPITLGAAWAAPPAMLQPAVFESPFSAMCHPAGRGDGTIADDVYALGVLLIVLATGQMPMAGLDDATIVRRKLDLGSFAALTEGVAIPAFLGDLLRGMLAEEAEHRPAPKLLTDPNNARIRRIAARPARRSQRPLMLNDIAVFDARTLAYALSLNEKKSTQALRNGLATHWLRRGLGDAGLAAQIEDLIRIRLADGKTAADADARLLMHTISTIEPRMPLCWREAALWPDAVDSLLAEGMRGNPGMLNLVEELLRNDILSTWSAAGPRGSRDDVLSLSVEGRQHRVFLQKGGEGALARVFYALNPLLPCSGQAMADAWVIGMPDLMRYLEKAAAAAPGGSLVDLQIRAFIAARSDRQIESAVNLILATKDPRTCRMRQLGLLRDLQQRHHAQPMPALAAWAAAQLRPELETWRNQSTRAALLERLDALAKAGFLGRLLALVEDGKARAEDHVGAARAAVLLAAIDGELAAIDRSDDARRVVMQRFGREIAAAAGMTALILMMLAAALG